jgi:PAS domain S-box-containing protein
VDDFLTQLTPTYELLRDAASCLIDSPANCDADAALSIILENEGTFYARVDAFVRQFQDEADASLVGLRETELLLNGLIVAILGLMALLVIRPTAQQLRTTFTDLLAAGDALRMSEARLRSIIDSQTAYVIRTSAEGSITYVNNAWARMFGSMVDQTQGTPARELVLPDDAELLTRTLEKCLASPGKPFQVTLRKPIRKDQMLWTLWEFVAITDARGMPGEIQGVGFNITDLQIAMDALIESEERFSSIFRSSPVPMVILTTDYDSRHVEVNEAYLQLIGYRWEEVSGRGLIELGIAIPSPERETRLRLLDEAGKYELQEGQIRNRAGEIRDVIISSRRTTIDGKHYDIEILLDVTERKHTDAFIRENERLKAGFQKEQEHNRLVQQTISTLAHDLRTPLAIISTSKDVLSLYFDRISPEQRQEKLDAIGRQLQFVQELLRDLTLVVQGKLNERPFNPSPVHLAALCRVSIDEISSSHKSKPRISFINHASVDVVPVDEILVSRVLVNLLNNAVKYSPRGGEIMLELDERIGWVILRVRDQGIGIPADALPHIFEPFFRAKGVDEISGTGLGLSIVKDCVERHQGSISVESEVGKGTVFTIELPISLPARVAS